MRNSRNVIYTVSQHFNNETGQTYLGMYTQNYNDDNYYGLGSRGYRQAITIDFNGKAAKVKVGDTIETGYGADNTREITVKRNGKAILRSNKYTSMTTD